VQQTRGGGGLTGVASFCGNRLMPERQPSRDRRGATALRANVDWSLPYGRGSEMPQNLAAPGMTGVARVK